MRKININYGLVGNIATALGFCGFLTLLIISILDYNFFSLALIWISAIALLGGLFLVGVDLNQVFNRQSTLINELQREVIKYAKEVSKLKDEREQAASKGDEQAT